MKRSPLKLMDGGGNRPIVGGIFKMMDTLGFPLEDSILESEQYGFAPGLPAFVCDAVLAGWTPDKAINRIESAWKELGRGPLPGIVKAGLYKAAEYPEKFSTKDGKDWSCG